MVKHLTWFEIAEIINQMALDERAKPALTLDGNTGDMVGFSSLEMADGGDTPAHLVQSDDPVPVPLKLFNGGE